MIHASGNHSTGNKPNTPDTRTMVNRIITGLILGIFAAFLISVLGVFIR